MRAYIDENLAEFPAGLRDYLQNINPAQWSYLFVSSQTRPHKNHLNVLKAYRGLLREEYINQKLVFTGRFSAEMTQYIKEEHLHLDVLSFHALPSRVHAAFYACASLTITPTLFEGGFPFTFSESLSVRTPVVLSDIPVTREVLTDQERQRYCFDPYNIQAMRDKIAWALGHREQLLKEELKTLEKMKARTWEDVASDYLRVFLSTDTRSD
jgi:glycosyltransferase involved in cell wall biosynthesis